MISDFHCYVNEICAILGSYQDSFSMKPLSLQLVTNMLLNVKARLSCIYQHSCLITTYNRQVHRSWCRQILKVVSSLMMRSEVVPEMLVCSTF